MQPTMASLFVHPAGIPDSTLGAVECSSEAILTVQAPLSTQGPHNPQTMRPMGPAYYQQAMPTSAPGPGYSNSAIRLSNPRACWDFIRLYDGRNVSIMGPPSIQAASTVANGMSSMETWSQPSDTTAYYNHPYAGGTTSDHYPAYPHGQRFAPNSQAATAVTPTLPCGTWAQSSSVTLDPYETPISNSVQPQDRAFSSLSTDFYVAHQDVPEARQEHAASLPEVIYQSYHDGPRMKIIIELYPRSEMPTA